MSVVSLRNAARRAAQHRGGCSVGIDGIALAPLPPGRAVGTVDLDHHMPARAEMSGQAGVVGAGALHPEGAHLPIISSPGQQLLIAGGVVGNPASASGRPTASMTAAWWVSLWVSTPTVTASVVTALAPWRAGDVTSGPVLVMLVMSSPASPAMATRGRAGWSDKTVTGASEQAPMRSRPPARTCVTAPPGAADRSQPRQLWRRSALRVTRPPNDATSSHCQTTARNTVRHEQPRDSQPTRLAIHESDRPVLRSGP